MYLEIITGFEMLSGLCLSFLGYFILKKDSRSFLNQILSLSWLILGGSLIFDGVIMFSQIERLLTLTEHVIAFTFCIGAGCFFLSGLTTVRGEDVKQLSYVVPVFVISIIPGTIILLTQSVELIPVDFLGETIINSSWGIVGEGLVLGVLILYFGGSLVYFINIFSDVTGKIKARLFFFILGIIIMGIPSSISIVLFFLIADAALNVLLITFGIYGSITLGAIIILLGFVRPELYPWLKE